MPDNWWEDPNLGAYQQAPATTPAPDNHESAIAKFINPIHDKVVAVAEAAARKYFDNNINPLKTIPALGEAIQHPLDSGLLGPGVNFLAHPLSGPPGARQTGEDMAKGVMSGTPEGVGGSIGDIGSMLAQFAGATTKPSMPIATVNTLRKSAINNYLDTLKPAAADVPKAERIAGQMADEHIVAPTRGNLQGQAKTGMEATGPQVHSAYNDPNNPGLVRATDVGAAGPSPSINDAQRMDLMNSLEDLRGKMSTIKRTGLVVDDTLNSYIDKQKQIITNMVDPVVGEILQKDLRDYREILGNKTTGAGDKFKSGDQLAPDSKDLIHDKLRASIRDVLHKANKPGEAADALYSMHKGMNDFLEAQRRAEIADKSKGPLSGGQNWVQSLLHTVPSGARSIPANIVGFMNSVPWNTVMGASKMKLADSLAAGDFSTATHQLQLIKLGVPLSDKPNDE